TRAMFIGYSTTPKGYKCFDPQRRRVIVSRDVKFMESRGYYDEKRWDELKDLSQSNDKATSLRLILEGLGINIPQDQKKQDNKEHEAEEENRQSNLDHEGGNENGDHSEG